MKRSVEKQTNPPLDMIINQTTWSRLKVCRLKPELIEAPPPPFKHPFKAHVYTWKYQPVWKNTLHAGFWASSANSTAGSDVKICTSKSLFYGSCTFTVEILWQLLIDVWRIAVKIQVAEELPCRELRCLFNFTASIDSSKTSFSLLSTETVTIWTAHKDNKLYWPCSTNCWPHNKSWHSLVSYNCTMPN